MRSLYSSVAAAVMLTAMLGCSKSPTGPSDVSSGPETPGIPGGDGPSTETPPSGDSTDPSSDPSSPGGPGGDEVPGGNGPGDSTSGGEEESAQGFLTWTLSVLPSGELQLHFKQTGLTVGSFDYTVGGTVDGDVQCYNKADNAPQGNPFHYAFTASATLGAVAVDGTVDATVTTAVMNNLCGNTKFYALPVTSSRPFTWASNFLVNPEGTLNLPDISLGDAPKQYASQ